MFSTPLLPSLVCRSVYNISFVIVMKSSPMINRELNMFSFFGEKRGNFFALRQANYARQHHITAKATMQAAISACIAWVTLTTRTTAKTNGANAETIEVDGGPEGLASRKMSPCPKS